MRRGGTFVVAAVLLVTVAACGGADDATSDTATTVTSMAVPTCGSVESLVEPGFSHVLPDSEVTYTWSPPTSGSHPSTGAPAPGAYDAPIEPIRQVSALGGGGVLVQYDATIDEDAVAEIESLVASHPSLVVAPVGEPMDGIAHVAATAWGKRMRCLEVDVAALEAFVVAHADKVHIHG